MRSAFLVVLAVLSFAHSHAAVAQSVAKDGKSVSEPARQIPVTHSADVVVVGAGNTGGLGGCFAAVAAARNGASVVIVEEGGYIGLHVPMGLGVVIGIKDWRPGMDEGLFKDFAGYLARTGQWSYT